MSIKALVNSQDWIPDLKKNPIARAALQLMHARLPGHVQQEIRIAAAVGGVDHFDAIAANFAYEVALVAVSNHTLSSGDLLRAFSGAKATPIGCTTFVRITAHERAETPINVQVEFARNLDWPDSDGSLKRYAEIRRGEPTNRKLSTYEVATFPGYSGVLTGFAPGRFAVAINAVMSDEPPKMGAAPTFLLRQALDECASFDAAVRLLSETPLVTSAAFTVASAAQFGSPEDAVVIERTPSKYALRRPEPVATDTWLLAVTNDMRRISDGKTPLALPGLSETTCARYDGVFRDVRAGLTAQTILSKAEFGCTVYRAAADVLDDPGMRMW